ncbi:MAG TPA: SulP family inorganic anion transporter [Gemmatimonadetes bacterium]|nr:SulP family inorganic anion transporter [Gemmatimonadota bacterium]
MAGLGVALMLIPGSMAYAELAGLSSHHGLYAAAAAPIAAALCASSPYLQTGPVTITALLTLGALLPLAEPGTVEFASLAALLAVVCGLVRIGVGLMKAGWVSYLMSRAVMTGFVSAAAILIVCSQLPSALGVNVSEGGVLRRALFALTDPGSWEILALILTAASVIVIVGGRAMHPLVPGVLVAALGGLLFSIVSGYEGSTVGEIPVGLPPLSIDLPWSSLPALFLPGAVIAVVGFADSASIARVFANEDRQRWNPSREFLSQGMANVAAGLAGGLPVGGSFARSSVNRLSGARSRWSGLVAGFAVLAFLPFTEVLAPLPRAVLSGIVIAAVWPLFRVKELAGLWAMSGPQAVVGWGTFGLTLALAPRVEQAVVLGVVMATAAHMWRELSPGVETRIEGEELHFEPKGVLWFGSAPALEDALLSSLAEKPDVQRIIVHCDGLGRIDLTAAQGIARIAEQAKMAGLKMEIRGVPEHAYRVLEAVGLEPM